MVLFSQKKGLVVGQVFVFIIAVVVFGLVLLFGYKMVGWFIDKGDDVQFYQFKTDLETAFQRIYTEYGSVRILTFHLPTKYKEICFIDLNKNPLDSQDPASDYCQTHPLGCDLWSDTYLNGKYLSGEENVLLNPIAPVKIKVSSIAADKGNLCIDITGGTFDVFVEGKGDHAFVSKPVR